MRRGWQIIVLFLPLGFLWCPTGEPRADSPPVDYAVTYLTDGQNLHRSAFFVGDRGYLLTVMGKAEEQTQIGKSFSITVDTPSDGVKKERVAIVDVHNNTGIALLRLTNMRYPFKVPLITADNIGDPFSIPSKELTIYYATPQGLHQNITVRLTDSQDGQLKIAPLGTRWTQSMQGSPVFDQNNLIGIVGNQSTIYPINHVAPFVTMAETTIIGKAKIEQLILGLAETKKLMTKKQQEEWEQFIKVAEFMRRSTPVVVNIDRVQQEGKGTSYWIVAQFQYPLDFMYNPEFIRLKVYPKFSYPSPSSSGTTFVSWEEVRDRSNKPEHSADAAKFVVQEEFRAPERDKKLKKEVFPRYMSTGLVNAWSLTNQAVENLKIVKFMVQLEWKFKDEESKDHLPLPHQQMFLLPLQ